MVLCVAHSIRWETRIRMVNHDMALESLTSLKITNVSILVH